MSKKKLVKVVADVLTPVNRIDMSYKDVTARVPELTEAARRVQAGRMTQSEYAALVNALKPVKPYEFIPKPATVDEAIAALTSNKRGAYGKTADIGAGEMTDLRLDIPAYSQHGVWVNSIHRKGAPTVYGATSSVTDATMIPSPEKAMKVATGETSKAPFAVIRGGWNPMDEAFVVEQAQKYLKHKDWRQVGYDPERHGYFYDRETMSPIVSADEVIQIGPLVLAKKPKYGDPEDFPFRKGGAVNKKIDEIIAQAKQGPVGGYAPLRTRTPSQYEKDFDQYLAAQQEARQRLLTDRIPKSIDDAIAKAAGLVEGGAGALFGYGAQLPGMVGDLRELYEEYKPEGWADAPEWLKRTLTTEQIQDLLTQNLIPPEIATENFKAGTTGGNIAAIAEGVASLPQAAKVIGAGVGKGVRALAPTANQMLENYMLKTGQILPVGPKSNSWGKAGEAISKAAKEAGALKAPQTAEKDLTTLQDFHTSLGDAVRARAMETQKMIEGFDYKYDKGQRVFTKSSADKNMPPYTILYRTRVGNAPMREDMNDLLSKKIIDPETGKTKRTPYEPGYRVRMVRGPDDWHEFDIPASSIIGDVEMRRGGAVHIGPISLDAMRLAVDRKAKGGVMGAADLVGKGIKLGKEMKAAAAAREGVPDLPPGMGGWMKGVSRTAEEAKRLYDIAKGTRSKAAQEAAGLYHPIGGGIKLSKPIDLMQFETVKDPTVEGVQRKIITPEDMQGGIGIPLVGDRAAGGTLLTSVEGIPFRSPLTLEAGPDYMLTHTIPGSPESSIWRSGQGVITGLQKQVEFARDMGRPIYGVNVVGAPTMVNYNTMVTEAILNQYDPAALTKKAKKEFLKDIRNYAPDPDKPHLKPGSVLTEADLNDVEALRAKMLAEGAGPLRKAFVERMALEPFQKMGFPDVPASRLATTEPLLVDVPTGSAGFTVGTIDPAARALEQTPRGHKSYSVALAGEYLGSLGQPIDYRNVFQGFADKRRLDGKPEGSDWRSFSIRPQIQTFDQEWLDRVMKSAGADKPREWKSGGPVEKADSGAVKKKAAGGLTSDDLVISERKL